MSTDELAAAHEAYRAARALDQRAASYREQSEASAATRAYVAFLLVEAVAELDDLMRDVLNDAGLRNRHWCEQIVWSDYSAQHPRTLHLWPDGHLFPAEDGVFNRTAGARTVCGERIVMVLGGSRPWQRAERGEWLYHYQALQRYRADVWRREQAGELNARLYAEGYEQARRICEVCAEHHGLVLECGEDGRGSPRWAPWRLAEIRDRVAEALGERLREKRPPANVDAARRVAADCWLGAELARAAREAKLRGPGPLRQMLGERNGRTSAYRDLAARSEPLGHEPHELLSEADWQRLLAEHATRLSDAHETAYGTYQQLHDAVRTEIEAKLDAGNRSRSRRPRSR